jgi:hypothetical protein
LAFKHLKIYRAIFIPQPFRGVVGKGHFTFIACPEPEPVAVAMTENTWTSSSAVSTLSGTKSKNNLEKMSGTITKKENILNI